MGPNPSQLQFSNLHMCRLLTGYNGVVVPQSSNTSNVPSLRHIWGAPAVPAPGGHPSTGIRTRTGSLGFLCLKPNWAASSNVATVTVFEGNLHFPVIFERKRAQWQGNSKSCFSSRCHYFGTKFFICREKNPHVGLGTCRVAHTCSQ